MSHIHVDIPCLLDQYILACDSDVICIHVHIPHLIDQYILDSGVSRIHVIFKVYPL